MPTMFADVELAESLKSERRMAGFGRSDHKDINPNRQQGSGRLRRLLSALALRVSVYAAIFLLASWTVGAAEPAAEHGTQPPPLAPLSPREALDACRVREDMMLELVAAEPLTVDPVAIDWGPDGRLWVVEMHDYPNGVDGRGKAGGRVRYLTDSDGDRRYDRSTVFLDGLNFPTGLITWRKGVLVAAPPDIVYAEDSDGDGRADMRTTLFSGFQEGNQQLRMNGLRWGLDNWIYCASGSHTPTYGTNIKIRSLKTGQQLRLGSADLRIRPDHGLLDPQSGPSQFGRNRDDWGNWFGVQNSYPLWHYVLADHYIRRNPQFAPPDPRRQVVVPKNAKVYPAKAPQTRFHSFEQAGRFTSACSANVYRDELLFRRDERQHSFTCEPVHNLVQHNVLNDDSVSFTARRDPAEKEFDFFASKDRWCRPVMVRTGPDGALWVVDIYRYIIEHPQWLPDVGKNELRPFYRAGDDRGRIYRVYPKEKPPRTPVRLDELDTAGLVAALDGPNGWQRDKAQQMLIWRNDDSAVGPLMKMAADSNNPLARLHALCTLDGLDALDVEHVVRALGDPHSAVRRHAVRLSEGRTDSSANLLDSLVRLVDDPDAKVRLQLACSLGEFRSPTAGRALGQLAVAAVEAPLLTAGIMSSVHPDNLGEIISQVLGSGTLSEKSPIVQHLLTFSVKFGDDDSLSAALDKIVGTRNGRHTAWQMTAISALLGALERNDTTLESLANSSQRAQRMHGQVNSVIEFARQTARDAVAQERDRIAAVSVIGHQPELLDRDVEALAALLTPRVSIALQSAVVQRLAEIPGEKIATVLLQGWRNYGPQLRARILEVLAGRDEWVTALLDHVERRDVLTADIDAAARQRLTSIKDKALRARAESLLARTVSSDRQKVIEQFLSALEMQGNRQRGAAVFKKTCAACHRAGGVGRDVGPQLAAITDKRPASVLVSILDPSRSVEPKYLNYLAETRDGRTFAGIVATETATSVTLTDPEGKQRVLLRTDVEALTSTGKSLMPDGLEQELQPQDLADLMAFLVQTLR